ncbi:Dol-P-Man:Man-PP-Dol alpha-1,3-mannosyltransferase [Golovinomyces cichoracearum]|uniref:Dol-P-Man:Man(5)GlcNAc(2)-PP-Dol alpha-1,3-mannosyltransferase n=1 Tax=Golovinomyces cichoracearum TaxID=62708 RepID=A0A420HAJ6_9PEZI|nr:Dol-P-Man:Man-PP-Dol alpha-1,3-mannosyltransferase [Golovinomyces cichoracearum]
MTPKNSLLNRHQYIAHVQSLLLQVQSRSSYVIPTLLLGDALLCSLIIFFVPYTEIDWKAYMEQVEQIVMGERNYTVIRGGTGPLVYPAAHVYLYWLLYQITDQGKNILLAQCLFSILYMATIIVVIACYRRAQAPLYVLPMLILSKRLHSIFLLRLFNDCFAVFFQWIAIYLIQRKSLTLGIIAYSWGLGTKMSLLLSMPAIGIISFLDRGVFGSLKQVWLILQLQIMLAIPFLLSNPIGYLKRAFDLSRQFEFKWTVNWRFIGEEMFLDHKFSILLLTGHFCTLLIFIITRWLRPVQKPFTEILRNILMLRQPYRISERTMSRRVKPKFIMTTILTANAIGFLFARSLHYQFYSYISLASPFLFWRAGFHPIFQYLFWAVQEWAWNVYPSTKLSSLLVVSVQLVTVASIWQSTKTDFILGEAHTKKKTV